MSVNSAIIANAVLDVAALGALGLVCRAPFRAMIMGRVTSAPAQLPVARDQRPTASRSRQRGGAAAAATNRSAR